MNKKWECNKVETEKVEKLMKKYEISRILAKILVKREIS